MKFLFSEEPWRREFKNSLKTGSSVKKKSSKSRMSTSKELCIDFNWIEKYYLQKRDLFIYENYFYFSDQITQCLTEMMEPNYDFENLERHLRVDCMK